MIEGIVMDQGSFWTEYCQQREHEVDEHVGRAEVVTHDSTEAFPAHFDPLQATDSAGGLTLVLERD